MAVDLKRYEELKSQVDKYQREADRAEGALAQLMERLESEHSCKTLKQAEKKVERLKKEANQAEEEFTIALAEFEKKWDHVLERNE